MNEVTEALRRSRLSVPPYFRSQFLAGWLPLRDRRSADRRVRSLAGRAAR
ncbi:MAG: hypothetical protein ABR880_25250 [Candidatus Sulfotelmatobacter sp.]|jgi:hypothetical protein